MSSKTNNNQEKTLPDIESVSKIIEETARDEIVSRFEHLHQNQIKKKESGEVVTDADLQSEKKLTKALRKTGGRNNTGRITMRRRGGGHKRRYRIIDFKRNKYNISGKVMTIEYDPNRSSFISLIFYEDGEKRYILSPSKLLVGDIIISGESVLL